jgi:hypothetical protein
MAGKLAAVDGVNGFSDGGATEAGQRIEDRGAGCGPDEIVIHPGNFKIRPFTGPLTAFRDS